MRYLPCRVCNQPALATRDGLLHCAATLSSPIHHYVCRRCGRSQTLTAADFNMLPLMSKEEIAAETCDLPVSALTELPPEPEPPTLT